MASMLVGMAERNIHLPLGMDLNGYIARIDSGAEGTHDELMVKSLVVRNSQETIIIVSCELLGLDSIFINETIKNACRRVPGIAENNVIICCTHTHSAPISVFTQGCGQENEAWQQALQETIVDCIEEAVNRITPSYITYKTGASRIGYNRIGHSIFSSQGVEKKSGNTDEQVGVLTVHNAADDKERLVLVNYACHPVVLTADNMLYSADYPHFMAEYLKRNLPDSPDIVFVNGCCGDIDPVKRGSLELAQEAGEELAQNILNIKQTTYSSQDDPDSVGIKNEVIQIPIQHEWDENKLLQLIDGFKRDWQEEQARGVDRVKIKICKAYMDWAIRTLDQLKTGTFQNKVEARISCIRIGKMVIVALPFEVYHDTGLKIKRHFGQDNTIIISYANGYFGYLASKDQYQKSKYETQEAFKYYGYPGPFSEASETILLDAVFRLG